MYLFIETDADGNTSDFGPSASAFGISASAPPRSASHRVWSYPITPDGVTLYERWEELPPSDDGTDSGVFADWLEDRKEFLLIGANGPSDPAAPLDDLIDWLRRRHWNGQE